ncbi:MAG: alpha/beta hydrolase fold domain-containing protein [Bryobacteraceae bacterium]|jgi:acetyl esterase/lipase/ketosteroid isomerase-like protein
MTLPWFSGGLAIGLLLSVCAPLSGQCTADSPDSKRAAAELERIDRDNGRLVASQNADGLAALYAQDAVSAWPQFVVRGREAIRDLYRMILPPDNPHAAWIPETVTACGSIAVERGTTLWTWDSRQIPKAFRYLAYWRREKSGWRIESDNLTEVELGQVLDDFASQLPQAVQVQTQNQRTEMRLKATLARVAEPVIRDRALHWALEQHMNDYGIKDLGSLVSEFEQACGDAALRADIRARYDKEVAAIRNVNIRQYKSVGGVGLDAYLCLPADSAAGARRPAFVFFHGGSWTAGTPAWDLGSCQHYAAKGMVGVSIEYRLVLPHGGSAVQAMADAKSAIRWLRAHAAEFGVDPDRIVAAGFSVGTHLSAAAATIEGFEEPGEDLGISSRPNALVLWSACVDVAHDGYFRSLLRGQAEPAACSPPEHIRSGLPPTLIVQGSEDDMCPAENARRYCERMQAAGNRCEYHVFEKSGHFIFNGHGKEIMALSDSFLASLKYLP